MLNRISTPLSRRLVRALKAAKVPGVDLEPDRYALWGLNPGHWQKGNGGWAWQLVLIKPDAPLGCVPLNIGSIDPASSLRKASRVGWFRSGSHDIEVCIDNRHIKLST